MGFSRLSSALAKKHDRVASPLQFRLKYTCALTFLHKFVPSPIRAAHYWFDVKHSNLANAALADMPLQL